MMVIVISIILIMHVSTCSFREAGSGGGRQGGGAESGPAPRSCDGTVSTACDFHERTREQKRQTEAAAAAGM